MTTIISTPGVSAHRIAASKLIISSDWHLRFEDDYIEPALLGNIDELIERNISYIALKHLFNNQPPGTVFICGGDLLDKYIMQEPVTINILKNITKSYDVYYILGQHDYRRSFGPELSFVSVFDNFHKLDNNVFYFEIENYLIEVFGFNWRPSFDILLKDVEMLLKNQQHIYEKHKGRILITVGIFHQIWEEWGSEFNAKAIIDLIDKYRDRAILFSGDLHLKKIYEYNNKTKLYTTSSLYPVDNSEIVKGYDNYGYYYEINVDSDGELECTLQYLPRSIYPRILHISKKSFEQHSEELYKLYDQVTGDRGELSSKTLYNQLPYLIIHDPEFVFNANLGVSKILTVYPQKKVIYAFDKKSNKDKKTNTSDSIDTKPLEHIIDVPSLIRETLKKYPEALDLFEKLEAILPKNNLLGLSKQDVAAVIGEHFGQFMKKRLKGNIKNTNNK